MNYPPEAAYVGRRKVCAGARFGQCCIHKFNVTTLVGYFNSCKSWVQNARKRGD
jgi:hypothetical protein